MSGDWMTCDVSEGGSTGHVHLDVHSGKKTPLPLQSLSLCLSFFLSFFHHSLRFITSGFQGACLPPEECTQNPPPGLINTPGVGFFP